MKALHVFPLFGPTLVNGSEYCEYHLTKALVRLRVDVEVFTTQSQMMRPGSAFSMDWKADLPQPTATSEGIKIHYFPTTFSVPSSVGHLLSRLMFRRWKKEESRFGVMAAGSRNLVDHYYLRAISRPAIYEWINLLGRGPHSLGLLKAVVRSIQRYDIVLVGFMPFALMWYLIRIAGWFNKPVVLLPFFHPDDLYHHFRIFYDCFQKADGVLAETSYNEHLIRKMLPDSNPIKIGVGVDHLLYTSPSVSGARFRRKYNLDREKIVLFVGRKEPGKRYDMAVQALDHIGDPRIKLVMIGADIDGRAITSPHVVYLGRIDQRDLVDAYDACDVFVLPSAHESFGIVFLEAWMRQKPVIGNAFCHPVASLIDEGKDGFLCHDAKSLADRILRLLSDPAAAAAFGYAGFKKTMENYRWDIIGCKVRDFYECVINDRDRLFA